MAEGEVATGELFSTKAFAQRKVAGFEGVQMPVFGLQMALEGSKSFRNEFWGGSSEAPIAAYKRSHRDSESA